jgi:hypothetical protein
MPLPSRSDPLSKPKLIVGEGIEEVFFFAALVNHLGLGDIQVEQYGGKRRLQLYVRELLVRPGYQSLASIGITRDTDSSVAQDFQSICGYLQSSGFVVPARAGLFGTGTPKVGVFLMPNNSDAGMLEDLCLASVQGDGSAPCLDEFFKCVRQQAGRQTAEQSKARMHAWLASQIKPDLRLGEAAKQSLFPWDAPVFQDLKQFLQNL